MHCYCCQLVLTCPIRNELHLTLDFHWPAAQLGSDTVLWFETGARLPREEDGLRYTFLILINTNLDNFSILLIYYIFHIYLVHFTTVYCTETLLLSDHKIYYSSIFHFLVCAFVQYSMEISKRGDTAGRRTCWRFSHFLLTFPHYL